MEKLKKVGLLVVIAGIAGSFCACNSGDNRAHATEGKDDSGVVEKVAVVEEKTNDAVEALKRDLNISNSGLPSEISDGIIMEKITYSDNVVTFSYVLDSDYYDESDLDDYMEGMKIIFSSDDEDIKSSKKLTKDAGASLRLVCKMDNGVSRSTIIPSSEL